VICLLGKPAVRNIYRLAKQFSIKTFSYAMGPTLPKIQLNAR